jgi:branched-chain amino acid transport system substrate-binding protein
MKPNFKGKTVNKEIKSDISRRDFMKKLGKGAVTLGAASVMPNFVKSAIAAKRDYILIGHPTSLTGALAGLGKPTQWVTDRAVKEINKDGGIYIKEIGKKLPVKVKVVDMESSPLKAASVASQLITRDKVDLMLVMYVPNVVNPVCGICEKHEIPCVALGVPIEAWLKGGPYKWSYQSFWTIDSWTDLYINTWDQRAAQTNKVVGGLFPDDPAGSTMASIFKKKLADHGYKFIDPGRFAFHTNNFAPMINRFKKEQVDILTGSLIVPDWANAWRQCHQRKFVPKMATIGKALLFPASLEAIGGDLGQGLGTEVWWSRYHPFRSSLSGETPAALCDAWEKQTKSQWGAPIGFKHAGYEIVFDALKRSQSLEKNALRDAVSKTDLNTIVGHIKFNEKHYCETPLVGGQWVKGKKWPWELQIVNNFRSPEISTTADMIFPLPT